MRMMIEPTNQFAKVDGVETRIWHGKTERGTRCFLLVHRLMLVDDVGQDEFAAELEMIKGPLQVDVFEFDLRSDAGHSDET